MSKIAEQLFRELKEAGSEIKAELSRLGTQGANEMASVLYSGNAYVQYGAGQYTKNEEQEQQPQVERQNDHSIEP